MLVSRTAERFKTRPSELLKVKDSYLAYCLDEAANLLLSRIESGEEPAYIKDAKHRESVDSLVKRARRKKKR